ncbi:MAG TPA: ExeM/NucH family extracellular endonuclease [Herpetosiphonaceae bacterium]
MFAPRPSIGHPFVRFCLALTLLLTALSVPAATPSASAASSTVVISQVYGGGGNSGASYSHDFVELFNRGTTTVSLNGWSIQYASATGTSNFGATTNQITELPNVSLNPGQYFLIEGATGSSGGSALPTPDVTDTTPINLSGSAGKVALANIATTLGCNGSSTACSPTAQAQIVDLVGYGTANFAEGAAAPGPTNNTTSLFRKTGGCTETDNNSNDFEILNVAPRNTGTTPAPCGGSGNDPVTPTCGGTLTTTTGTAATRNVTATDANGTVVSATVTNVTPTPGAGSISITSSAPAAGPGGTLQATLTVSASVPAGSYSATITFANNDETPQTATCTITIQVTDPAVACPGGVTLTAIPAIQGSGAASPIENSTVTLQGIVTGDFQGTALLGGFYVQDPTGDGAVSTSDGIFVYAPSSSVDVNVGDLVRVTGQVKEFNTLTEIDSVTAVTVCSAETPITPTTVDLPVATFSDLEHYEGMLITIPETMTVSQNFFQGRYGQVHLSAEGRMYTPTNDQGNSADYNLRRSLVLDDGRTSQNPNPIPYIGADGTLRAGDTTTGLTGLVHYGPINSDTSIRGYTLQPTITPTFARTNPRTAGPPAVGGELKVASFNVLNYFTTIDQSGASCFPSGTRSDCRGADSAAEFTRQRDKIIAALVAIDADVVGLIEIENNGGTAIGNLVSGLNAATAPGTYAAVPDPAPIGQPGDDAIKVALIYKPGRLSRVGASASSTDGIFDRPPAAQTFQDVTSGEKFTVIVNHFKSKGSCPSNPSDPNADQGDGQGCWNVKRVEQAEALLGFINQRITATGDTDVLVIGDLNAYGQEDPIDTLVTGGLVNQVALRVPLAERYSYVFDGQSGYLDHGLSTQSLSGQVTGVTYWHINADEPSVIDYNTEFKPQDLYAPNPYRSSDHDPVIIGLNLGNTYEVYLPMVSN